MTSQSVLTLGNNNLWLILCVALPVLALRGYLSWSQSVDRKPLIVELIFKAIVLICLALAVSDLSWLTTSKISSAAVLLDVSDSMDVEATDELLKSAKKLVVGSEVEVIPFAAKAGSPEIGNRNFKSIKDNAGKLDIGNSNLEAGLQAVANQYASVLLVSDANETIGDATKVAERLATTGSKIFPLLPANGPDKQATFRVSNLYAPLVAPAQKSVEVRVSILNTTSQKEVGQLELKHGTKTIYSSDVSVEPGKEIVVIADSDPAYEGLGEITAKLSPKSSGYGPSSETIYLSGEKREKVLLLSGAEEDGAQLTASLEGQAYQLSSKTATSGRISSVSDLSDYSVVMLNNIRYEDLPAGLAEGIRSYTKAGGGLVMIGGNRSFGLGGYRKTPIEEALPVNLLPPQTVKKRLNVAVELILDKSQSMAENDKLQLTKEAARELIGNLKDEDYIGVIGFDSVPFEVVELTQLRDGRDSATRNVGLLFPRGKTNLMPAIDEGRRRLERVAAGRKHMIILTDGELPDGGPTYIELTKQLRLEGITVSTIMVGNSGVDEILKSMAEVGGGSFYQTFDPRSLPRIFLADVKVSSGEQTMKEATEFVVRHGPDDLTSTRIESFPPVKGYVETEAKNGANTELVAYGEGKAEPLLASWQYGQGRAVAFTSDANGRWSDYWIRWPRFAQFWTEIIDSIRPQDSKNASSTKFDLRTSVDRGELKLDLSLFNGQDVQQVKGQLTLPDGSLKEVYFKKVVQGRYLAELSKVTAGKYIFQASVADRKLTQVAFNLSGELFGEKKGQGFKSTTLERLASMTGGKINPNKEDLAANSTTKTTQTSLAPWLLMVAALFYLLAIGIRERVWSGAWRNLRRQSSQLFLRRRPV